MSKNFTLLLLLLLFIVPASQAQVWQETFNTGDPATKANPGNWVTNVAKDNPFPPAVAGFTYTSVVNPGAMDNDACHNYWIINNIHVPDTLSTLTSLRQICVPFGAQYTPTDPNNQSLHMTYNDACSDLGCGPGALGLHSECGDLADAFGFYNDPSPNTPAWANSDQWAYYNADINTTGRCDLTLSFHHIGGSNPRIYREIVYSTDGGATWKLLTSVAAPNYGRYFSCDWGWQNYSVKFPSDADNISNLRIGFRWRNVNNSPTAADEAVDHGWAIDNIKIVQGDVPVSQFTASPVAPYCKTVYTLTNTTTDNAPAATMTYRWTVPANAGTVFSNSASFTPLGGDVYETTSKALTPILQFTINGSYPITLVAENCNGVDATPFVLTFDVVDCPPVAAFTADFTTVCSTTPAPANASSQMTVTFTDQSINTPTSWAWSFDPASVTYQGGTNATSQNPQVRFNAPGNYEVTLTATNADGSDAEVKTSYITVLNCQCVTPVTGAIPVTLFSEDFDGALNWQNTAGAPDMFAGTDPNGVNMNEWYIGDDESGMTPGSCGTGGTGNNSLFVGIESASYGTLATGAVYIDANDGFADSRTDLLTPSQSFSTIGHSNITLDFNYIMGNLDPGQDHALVYYSLNGTDWTLANAPAATNCCEPTVTPVAGCPDAACALAGGTCDPGGVPGCDWGAFGTFAYPHMDPVFGFFLISDCASCASFGGTCVGGSATCTTNNPAGTCDGTLQGTWTAATPINLPAEVEDKPTVYIAFRWRNDGDDGTLLGTFMFTPAFAVDNIVVRGTPFQEPITAANGSVWMGSTSDWHDPNNWNPSGVPTNTTIVLVPKVADLTPGAVMPIISAGNGQAKSICNEGSITIGTAGTPRVLTVGEPGVGGFLNNYGTITTPNDDSGSDLVLRGTDVRYRGNGLTHDVDVAVEDGATVATLENNLSCRDFTLVGGTLDLNEQTLTLKRNFDALAGSVSASPLGTVVFDGPITGLWNNIYDVGGPMIPYQFTDGIQRIDSDVALSLPNVRVQKAVSTPLTAINPQAISVTGSLYVQSGIFDINERTIDGAATLQIDDNGELWISKGGVTVPEVTGTYTLSNNSLVKVYDVTSGQNVRAASYGRLENSGFGTETRGQAGDVEVRTSLLLDGVIYTQGSNRLYGAGSLTMLNAAELQIARTGETVPSLTGDYTLNTGTTVHLNAAGNQTLRAINTASGHTSPGYSILRFSTTGVKTLAGDVNVEDNLLLNLTTTAGNYVDAQEYTLHVRNSAGNGMALAAGDAIERTGGHVRGWLQRDIDNTAAFDYVMPVGSNGTDNATYYEPVRVQSTGAWTATNDYIRSRFYTGAPTPNLISPTLTVSAIDYEAFETEGYWTVEAEEALGGGQQYEIQTYPSAGWVIHASAKLAKSSVFVQCPTTNAYCGWDLTTGTELSRDHRQGFTGFSDFAYAIPVVPLPVESGQLSAVPMQSAIALNWRTTAELNNMGFRLKRGLNAEQMEEITFVQGAGTVNEPRTYSHFDYNVKPGITYYYQYDAVDFDGATQASNVAAARLDAGNKLIVTNVYPNPAHDVAYFSVMLQQTSQVSLQVHDANGKLVAEIFSGKQAEGRTDYEWRTQGAARGLYFYTLTVGNEVIHGKLLVK